MSQDDLGTADIDAWSFYDTFEAGVLDSNLWTPAHPPRPGGGLARHDQNARVSCRSEGVVVKIPQFCESQLLDPLKFLMVSRALSIPDNGAATFGVDMRSRSLGGDSVDVRLGAATFNVLADEGRYVFDTVSTSSRVCALHERFPWAVGKDPTAFSHLVESPALAVDDDPDAYRSCEIALDRGRGSAEWRIGGDTIYHLEPTGIPRIVTFGFGIFTFLPHTATSGRRLQGRGVEAAWRRFRYRGAHPVEV